MAYAGNETTLGRHSATWATQSSEIGAPHTSANETSVLDILVRQMNGELSAEEATRALETL